MPLAPATAAGSERRAPGSFSTNLTPLSSSINVGTGDRPPIRRVQSDSSEGSGGSSIDVHPPAPLQITKQRLQNAQAQQRPQRPSTPGSSQSAFSIPTHANNSTSSLQNFSRPSAQFTRSDQPLRTGSPLALPARAPVNDQSREHSRKHSQSQGFFEPSLSNASFLPSNIGAAGTVTPGTPGTPSSGNSMAPASNLSASQIAAQAAMHNQSQHMRQRSQTLPLDNSPNGSRRPSRGPVSPPLLSLTEASGERAQSGFGGAINQGQIYKNGLLGGGTTAATTAANVVFPRSPQTSPGLPPTDFFSQQQHREPEKPAKTEKSSKVKLFSRPGKISTKEAKEKPMPSPNKFGSSMASLQRANMSMNSLVDPAMSSASSMYSMTNSSSATIRPIEVPETKDKEKEKKHNFLSRQKHKLSSKDDHHLPLSSAASNSRPVDPHAPSSLYNFNLPPSPGPSTTSFAKSMSGLDLRHGGRALREKKKEEKAAAGTESSHRENESAHQGGNEWPGPSSLGSAGGASFLGLPSTGYASSIYSSDVHADLAKYGLNNMTADDAWPFLKAKLLIIFEGEDLRLPLEDFNRLVSTHLQRCIQKRSPNVIIEDLRDLLNTGFSSLDLTLRRTPDERLIPHLVEMWLFTFTSILPYMQAVFLPLDLEFSGHGPLMSKEMARDFWGALPSNFSSNRRANVPASQFLEVRRIVLTTYRDIIILPRFETLKTIFSRLSLESINTNLNLDALSTSPDSGRPGTAMSLDPSTASYSSQSTTLLGGAESSGARSRAISNVSFGSDQARNQVLGSAGGSDRPFTPSSTLPSVLAGFPGAALTRQMQREVNAVESTHVTETVGRMLQCMSVLSSVGYSDSTSSNNNGNSSGSVSAGGIGGAGGSSSGVGGDEESQAQAKMEELCRGLKLNWLGRGRTGRNRRGFVGARVRNDRARGGGAGGNGGMGELSDVVEGSML